MLQRRVRCEPGHDRLLEHKQALFDHLVGRWRDLFNISFDVLLYDLTSTYFEAGPPFAESDKRRYGYSRDHRPDCVQVVIALVMTPEGLPLARWPMKVVVRSGPITRRTVVLAALRSCLVKAAP